jgi:hypothetical protein
MGHPMSAWRGQKSTKPQTQVHHGASTGVKAKYQREADKLFADYEELSKSLLKILHRDPVGNAAAFFETSEWLSLDVMITSMIVEIKVLI